MIPVLRPSVSDAEIEAVTAVLRSGWWGDGPVCAQFERELAERAGYAHCVTVNSGTAALHLALLALGVGPGDEVIVPALTFVSTALAVTYTGARPVFADVYPETLTLSVDDVQRKQIAKTKAIIPMDFAGFPAFRPSSKLPVIEDAAHMPLGMHTGNLVCYSFHPVKPLATGDGGAILTDDGDMAERLRALRWCDIDRSTWQRSGKRYSWDYDIAEVGYKYHWNDIQAAIGLAQLRRYKPMQARRREIALAYEDGLKQVRGIELPQSHPYHAWHLYAIRVPINWRNRLIDWLASRDISASVHYKPLTHYPMYADQKTPPVTETEWQRLVSLPIFPDMTDDEVLRVIDAVAMFAETLA